jgi:hypothetical protein
MAIFVYSDFATTTLAANIGPSAVLVTLAPGSGALFPAPASGQQFALVFNDALTRDVFEVAYCTHRSGDVLTIVRGQEGSTAKSWVIGDFAYNPPTSGQMNNLLQIPHLTDSSLNPVVNTLTATGGNIVASGGKLQASGDVESIGGNIVADSGGVSAQTFISANTGDIVASAGNIIASAGEVVGQVGVIAATGNVLASAGLVIGQVGVTAITGNIVANAGRLRASLGALGSGDVDAAVLLQDFPGSFGGIESSGYVTLPNGILIQWLTLSFGAPVGTFNVNFPTPFPNACFVTVGSVGSGNTISGAPNAWGGVQPVSNTQCQVTLGTAPGTGAVGMFVIAIGN